MNETGEAVNVRGLYPEEMFNSREGVLRWLGLDGDGNVGELKSELEDLGLVLDVSDLDHLIGFVTKPSKTECAILTDWELAQGEKLGMLLLVSTVNLVDDVFESKVNPFEHINMAGGKVEVLDECMGVMFAFEDKIYTLGSMLRDAYTLLGAEGVEEEMMKVFAAQVEFTQKVESRTIDEAIEYRGKTLGVYFKVMEMAGGKEGALRALAWSQYDDDYKDIDEDMGNVNQDLETGKQKQIQPFVSLVEKYDVSMENLSTLKKLAAGIKTEYVTQMGKEGSDSFGAVWQSVNVEGLIKQVHIGSGDLDEFREDLKRVSRFYLVDFMQI